ncbi:DNA primase, partial [Coxiella burnetii]|uniref:DNA primase n=2 Tax=Coxiella burnetii TaxID=777 RepID=UPI0022329C3B
RIPLRFIRATNAMNKRIPQSFIQDLLSRTDIVELIQSRVAIKKRGANYLGLCPFHTEKTPSFTVSSSKQFYYCFGCAAHGNAISFLMAFDRMEFLEAVTDLANQLGIEIPHETIGQSKTAEINDDFVLLTTISRFYQRELKRSPTAIHYLKSRGLTGETAKQFAIGYAPNAWENLRPFAKNSKTQSQLVTHGLLVKKENRCFDRFRHRIMFPIRDVRGRVIAFGGRSVGEDLPKYMNSPETPLFQKGNELYGLHEACKTHRPLPRALIVEGYMDVVSLHQHGITYAVATLGTATSVRHLQKLLRYTHEIIYCFDGDDAGRQAAWRALTSALPVMREGIHIRFLFLPQGEDPDSLIQKIGREAFENKIDQAPPLSEVFFSHLQKEIPIRSIDDKAAFAKQALEHLRPMPRGIFYQLLLEELAQRLTLDLSELDSLTVAPPPMPAASTRVPSLAYHALSILAQAPSLVSVIQDMTIPKSEDPQIQFLAKMVLFLKKRPVANTGELLAFCPESQRRLLAQLAAYKTGLSEDDLAAELKDAINRLHEQHQKEEAFQALIKASHKETLEE